MKKQIRSMDLRLNQIIYNAIDDGYGYIQFFRVAKIEDDVVTLDPLDQIKRGQGVFHNSFRRDHCLPAIALISSSGNSLIICLGDNKSLTSKHDLPIEIVRRTDSYFDLNEHDRYDRFTHFTKEIFSELWDVWDKEWIEIETYRHWQPDDRWQFFHDEMYDDIPEPPGLDFDTTEDFD